MAFIRPGVGLMKKLCQCVVFLLFVGLTCLAARANALEAQPLLEQVKIDVANLGTVEKSHATIVLNSGKKVSGYICDVTFDKFVIRDSNTGQKTTIPYAHVVRIERKRIHPPARGLAIGAMAGAGAIAAIMLGLWLHNDS